MTPEEEIEIATAEAEAEEEARRAAQPSMATNAIPSPPPERKIGEMSDSERRLSQIASFMSGSPLFGTVAKAAGALGVGGGGANLQRSAQRATEQASPKVAGVPLLPLAGSMVATAPAGAARIGGTLGGIAMNTPKASLMGRVGLQGFIGGVTEADKGGGAGDVVGGVAGGLAGGVFGEAAAAGLSRIGAAATRPLKELAETQAIKALVGGGTIVNRLKDRLGIRSEDQLKALGRQVLDDGMLSGRLGVPRTTIGINEANKRATQSAGARIGEGIETWDRLAAEEAKQALASGQPSWTRPNASSAREAFERGATAEAQKTGTAVMALPEVLPAGAALDQPNVNTMRRLWDTKAELGREAFPQGAARLGEKSRMMRAGQQNAARNIESQLESRIGPDEMGEVREAMRRYGLGKRIEGVVEDAATRDMAKSGPGFKDWQAAETLGATGLPGLATAMAAKTIRGRGNAGLAMGANLASRHIADAGGLAGAAVRSAVPATQRQSIADPLGPLRSYLALPEEERKDVDTEAFKQGGE